MKIEKEFIPYEQALALKELGFRESCFAYYNNHSPKNNHQRGFIISQHSVQDHNEETEGDDLICSAPLYQQAFRWFREKYELSHSIESHFTDEWFYFYKIEGKYRRYNEIQDFNTYEEAELECLKKLIEIVKNK